MRTWNPIQDGGVTYPRSSGSASTPGSCCMRPTYYRPLRYVGGNGTPLPYSGSLPALRKPGYQWRTSRSKDPGTMTRYPVRAAIGAPPPHDPHRRRHRATPRARRPPRIECGLGGSCQRQPGSPPPPNWCMCWPPRGTLACSEIPSSRHPTSMGSSLPTPGRQSGRRGAAETSSAALMPACCSSLCQRWDSLWLR